MRQFSAICVLLVTTGLGAAVFQVDPASTLTMQGVLNLQLTGTLIGDWEEETNPDGTQTRPGLWGGSGNQPIDLEIGLTFPIDLSGSVNGSMDFSLGEVPGTCMLNDVYWTLGFDDSGGEVLASLLYDTFRSINPDSLYIGGFPIEFPIGASVITDAYFEQQAPGGGTAIEVPDSPGVYDVLVTAPGTMFMTIELFGTPMPAALPIAVVLQGTYETTPDGDILHLMAEMSSEEQFDLPDTPLPPLPFELPTIVPPGDFAGVVLNLTPATAAWSATLMVDISGQAEATAVPGDADGDGVVNTNDILAILSAWGQCKGCPEDLNTDGLVGVDDILLVIAHWG